MRIPTRREFLQAGGALGAAAVALGPDALFGDVPDISPGARPSQAPGVEILSPRDRVPLSFIIDDSTCLVNMGHFCMPQFAEAWPEREDYKKPWKTWPREIPDDFVREFGEWCSAHGVKGKYSVVPNPACVGWLDRELPGWSRSELPPRPRTSASRASRAESSGRARSLRATPPGSPASLRTCSARCPPGQIRGCS